MKPFLLTKAKTPKAGKKQYITLRFNQFEISLCNYTFYKFEFFNLHEKAMSLIVSLKEVCQGYKILGQKYQKIDKFCDW